MNCCKHKYFVIFRGDDTDFPGNQELVIEIDTTRDLTGCSAHFSFQGFVQDFAEIPADRKLRLVIPNSETGKFALGAADARLWLTNGQKIRTVENKIHIVVTNRVEEAYDNDDPQAITVTISGGGGGSTVVLDDTVTAESQNGVKSSGIWSWVKSLLPRWLTSDYAEPATVASVSAKADRSELGGYLPLSGGLLSGKVYGQGWWLDSGCLYLGDGLLIGGDNRPLSIVDYGNAYLLNDAGGHKWFYGDPDEQDNEIAVKGDISALEHSLAEKANSVDIPDMVWETMSAGGISSGGIYIGGPIIGLTIGDQDGDLREAMNDKVGSFESVGGATATVENGVAKLNNFFTESNSLLNGRLAYSRNATGLKDRAFNTLSFDGTEFNLSTALEEVTPTASGHPRDLLIVATATAATTIGYTAGTIKGDKPTIDGSGTWLITLTEYASGVWYCRQIKMEDAA